jgi:hypothetical protein
MVVSFDCHPPSEDGSVVGARNEPAPPPTYPSKSGNLHPRKGRRAVTAIHWIRPARQSLCWCSTHPTCQTKPATAPWGRHAVFRFNCNAAEGRIDQLQAELERSQDRAARAEKWLAQIYQEIEKKLIHSRQ